MQEQRDGQTSFYQPKILLKRTSLFEQEPSRKFSSLINNDHEKYEKISLNSKGRNNSNFTKLIIENNNILRVNQKEFHFQSSLRQYPRNGAVTCDVSLTTSPRTIKQNQFLNSTAITLPKHQATSINKNQIKNRIQVYLSKKNPSFMLQDFLINREIFKFKNYSEYIQAKQDEITHKMLNCKSKNEQQIAKLRQSMKSQKNKRWLRQNKFSSNQNQFIQEKEISGPQRQQSPNLKIILSGNDGNDGNEGNKEKYSNNTVIQNPTINQSATIQQQDDVYKKEEGLNYLEELPDSAVALQNNNILVEEEDINLEEIRNLKKITKKFQHNQRDQEEYSQWLESRKFHQDQSPVKFLLLNYSSIPKDNYLSYTDQMRDMVDLYGFRPRDYHSTLQSQKESIVLEQTNQKQLNSPTQKRAATSQRTRSNQCQGKRKIDDNSSFLTSRRSSFMNSKKKNHCQYILEQGKQKYQEINENLLQIQSKKKNYEKKINNLKKSIDSLNNSFEKVDQFFITQKINDFNVIDFLKVSKTTAVNSQAKENQNNLQLPLNALTTALLKSKHN